MAKIFDDVKGFHPRRSRFNLSYNKAFDCEMGKLIPVMCEEVVPGDKIKLGNEFVIRFQPTVAPIPDDISVKVDYFQVPNRLVFNEELDGSGESWENFITKGVNGDLTVSMPKWNVSSGKNGVCSLWDYFGFPVNITPAGKSAPTDLPKRAYNLIWNEFYRDETLQEEVDILTNEDLLNRCWSKDYFTSSLPFQQRGPVTALPVNSKILVGPTLEANVPLSENTLMFIGEQPNFFQVGYGLKNTSRTISASSLVVNSTAFDVTDLRLAFQIQKWQERNARGGVRYTEFLQAHFGVHPRDDRLQRPQYLGGTRTPVITSEVLQTSQTTDDSPQGNFVGHMITADANNISVVNVQEYGWIIGIMSIVPKARYTQGINRQFLRNSPFDFYFPEFANLSEQAIYNEEVFAQSGADKETENLAVWGYQGRYDEMRYKPSQVCGNLRGNLDYWTLARKFDSLPNLNAEFVKCVPSKRIFAVTSEETPAVIVNFYNKIRALRPLPYIAEPGLIDHN